MFKKFSQFLNFFEKQNNKTKNNNDDTKNVEPISKSIKKMKSKLEETFCKTSDLIIREIEIGKNFNSKVLICYIDGLIDKKIVNESIMQAITSLNSTSDISLEVIYNTINNSTLKRYSDLNMVVDSLLSGSTLIYLDGESNVLAASTEGWKQRSIEEPNTEPIIRGPREGFVETLRTNTSLLRRRIKNPNFRFEDMAIGERTKTKVSICYIEGLADREVIKEVKDRLGSIDTDSILDSGYIAQFIKNNKLSIFQTVGESERADKVAGKILEGKVAIVVDGSPQVLTVPFVFFELLQSSEDYYINPYYATILRLIRFLALNITILLPGFYVGLLEFHQSVIPFKLMLTILSSRAGLPFSPFIESIIMITIFEILREAGARMPKNVGQSVSIAGAIVLGQAASSAGIASTPMIIVVALTAISSFLTPSLTAQIIILRFVFLIAANILGFMGIALLISLILIYLCSIESFGVPYLYPVVPINIPALKDSLIKLPISFMYTSPSAFINKSKENYIRTVTNQGNKEDEQ